MPYMQRTISLVLFFAFLLTKSLAQEVSSDQPQINFSGYLETYFAFDFNRPFNNERPGFLYNHTRHNEVSVNLGLIQMNVAGGNYRANLGLMVGTYAEYNLADEQGLLKNIFEANVGVALNSERNLWVDAGIFASHIGFESAIGADNFTLSRSLLAENSPYFLSGVKVIYTPNDRWELAALVTNGWQRIRRVDGNSTPGIGTQVTYTAEKGHVFNWSTFIGSDDPDPVRRMRYFNNFYGQFEVNESFSFIAGVDIGAQQVAKGSSNFDVWYTPIVIARMELSAQWGMAVRGECFSDENGVVIDYGSPVGFRTSGISLNFDRKITENVLFRIEARSFRNADPIFEKNGDLVTSNFFLLGALTARIP